MLHTSSCSLKLSACWKVCSSTTILYDSQSQLSAVPSFVAALVQTSDLLHHMCRDEVAQTTAEYNAVGREVLETSQQADKRVSLQRDLEGIEQHNQELQEAGQKLQSSMGGLEGRRRQLMTYACFLSCCAGTAARSGIHQQFMHFQACRAFGHFPLI